MGAHSRPREDEISNTIKRLVAHELIRPAQLSVHHAIRVQHDGVLHRRALNQPFGHAARRPRARTRTYAPRPALAQMTATLTCHAPSCSPDHRMRKRRCARRAREPSDGSALVHRLAILDANRLAQHQPVRSAAIRHDPSLGSAARNGAALPSMIGGSGASISISRSSNAERTQPRQAHAPPCAALDRPVPSCVRRSASTAIRICAGIVGSSGRSTRRKVDARAARRRTKFEATGLTEVQTDASHLDGTGNRTSLPGDGSGGRATVQMPFAPPLPFVAAITGAIIAPLRAATGSELHGRQSRDRWSRETSPRVAAIARADA